MSAELISRAMVWTRPDALLAARYNRGELAVRFAPQGLFTVALYTHDEVKAIVAEFQSIVTVQQAKIDRQQATIREQRRGLAEVIETLKAVAA